VSARQLMMCSALLACAVAPPVKAAEPKLPRDGWASWPVATVEGAPDWCCFDSRKGRDAARGACQLDEHSNGFGNRDDATTNTAKVYARSTGGKLDRLQILSATCAVETKTPVQTIEGVSDDDSARWLVAQAKQSDRDAVTHEPIGESALAALAMHRGDLARDALAGFARNDARVETRKWAVFWVGQLRGDEGAGIVSSVMFADQDVALRKHAAFALAQSKSARVAPDLIRLGNTDKVGEVRGEAWFWLAQTGAPQAEDAIVAALKKDTDSEVLEKAIFALSQLPDERAARALIGAAQDQSLPREQRKRAVFWLSQSESDAALAYLDKVLTQ
jgi:HEAT repeat protein